jgi:hypothetical protein
MNNGSDREKRRRGSRPARPEDEYASEAPEDTPASAGILVLRVGSGSGPGCCRMACTWVSRRLAVGRSSGCLARQLPIRPRSSPGTESRQAGLLTSR